MATPEPERILSTTPMTADKRWPPVQLSVRSPFTADSATFALNADE